MARAVLGPLVIDLRGKLGNQVFDNYKGIHIVRAMPSVTTNPQSYQQTIIRTALAVFIQAWRGLTLAQKQLWAQIAAELIHGKESDARMNRGGLITVPRGPFSGYNAFIAFNMNRYTSGYSVLTDILEDAPISKPLPEPLKTFSAVVVDRTITASWTYINPGPLAERLEIWIKSIDAGIHPQLIYTEARNADGNTDITQARKTSGILVNLPNGVYQLQAMIVNQYGLTTAPSELVFVQLGGEDVFTYLATPINVWQALGQAASIPRAVLDLSGNIPAGAHTAILRLSMAVFAYAAPSDIFSLYADAGVATAQMQVQNDSPGVGKWDDEGLQPIKADRSIEYEFVCGAGNTSDLNIFLIGYIS